MGIYATHEDKQNWAEACNLVGLTGRAQVIEVWAVISNTDLNDSNYGEDIDISYHVTEEAAKLAAKRKGCMGTDGEIAPRLAILMIESKKLLLLSHFVRPTAKTLPVIEVES